MVDEILVIYLKCKSNGSFWTENKTEEFTDKLYLNSRNTLAKMTLTRNSNSYINEWEVHKDFISLKSTFQL